MDLACDRCGECCRRSTPALHQEDLALIGGEGGFDLVHLVTFRRGELVHDQIRGELVPLEQEVVKLRSLPGGWACMFLLEPESEEETAGCARYQARPLECRLLLCKDPEPLAAAYDTGRITRHDIVGAEGPIAELIAAHEARCGYKDLAQWARRLHADATDTAAQEAILAAVRFDAGARSMLLERLPAMDDADKAAVAACCLGRPLTETIPAMFGLELRKSADGAIHLAARGVIHHPAARP